MGDYKQHLHTTVWNCTENDFKKKVTKLILGVTYSRYKRKKGLYYQHNQHNTLVARRLTEDLYAKLLELKDLSEYYVTVDFDMSWNSTGRITGASEIEVSIFMPVGKVTARSLQIYKTTEKVKLEVFVSDVDSGSKSLLKLVAEIKKQYGEESFDYQEHKLNAADYKKYAKPYGIDTVPTVVINDKKFEKFTESQIRSNIEAAINSAVFLQGIRLRKFVNELS
jgi:glutaredoxin